MHENIVSHVPGAVLKAADTMVSKEDTTKSVHGKDMINGRRCMGKRYHRADVIRWCTTENPELRWRVRTANCKKPGLVKSQTCRDLWQLEACVIT